MPIVSAHFRSQLLCLLVYAALKALPDDDFAYHTEIDDDLAQSDNYGTSNSQKHDDLKAGYGYGDYHNDDYHGYHDDGYGYHDDGDGYHGYHHYGYKPRKKRVYVPVFVPDKEKKKSEYFPAFQRTFRSVFFGFINTALFLREESIRK